MAMTLRIAGGMSAVTLICAIGCGSHAGTPPEPVGGSASAIQGGATDTSHHFAIGICGGAAGGPGGGYNCPILCSGTLIAPNLVISARHCVDTTSAEKVDCSTDAFGKRRFPANEYYVTSSPEFAPQTVWYQVSEIITPTPEAFCNNDLSLLILSANVPSSEVPVLAVPEIWHPIYDSIYSSRETAIGYGQDTPTDAGSSGVRRILENIAIECIPGDPHKKLACATVTESGVGMNEFQTVGGTCPGDSGSSAFEQKSFDNGSFLSLGVLSRGGSFGGACSGSTYTQLYPWRSLIVSTAQEAAVLGGYPAPSWTASPTDGGSSEAASPRSEGGGLPFGSTCDSNGACASNQCVSRTSDGGFVCSQACSSSVSCPSGYGCFMDYCFAGEGTAETSSGGAGGCQSGKTRPSGRHGWALALGFCVLVARRRRARSGHGAHR
jgi:hypothetical protein